MELSSLFNQTFEPALLKEMEECTIHTLPKNTELRHEVQSKAHYTPIVLEGTIRVMRIDEKGKEILLYFINKGETCFLNITAALNNDFGIIKSLKAVTTMPTKMLSISDSQIRDWNNRFSSWRDFISLAHNQRFLELFSIIDNVVFKSVDEKLRDILLELKDSDNKVEITHKEIAYRIGSAREVVSRMLKILENEHKVKLTRGCIEILNL